MRSGVRREDKIASIRSAMTEPVLPARAKASPRLRRLKAALRRAIGLTSRRRRRRRAGRFPHHPDIAQHWELIVISMLRFGRASSGNRVKMYCDGDERLDDIWQSIDQAKKEIWFEIYTLEPDRVGNRTIEVLARAAERGCKVTLLYDGVGSSHLTESVLRPLRQAGAEIEVFNPIWRWRRKIPLLRRDHRKIIIIDGQIAFCGGMNISEQYAGTRYGNGRFRDCHVRLEGPCVRDLASVFASSWKLLHKGRKRLPRRTEPAGSTFAQVFASSGAQGRRLIQRTLRLTIRNALHHCYITTPYFIPPLRLMRAINRAAQRGVDVRILTAGISDVPIVRMAAQHIYGAFLRHGVSIYEMFDSTLHAKTLTIDGLYGTVGSFNLDTWSDKRNLEVNVAMIDQNVAGDIQSEFLKNIKSSTEVTLDNWQKRPWWRRVLNWAAYQVLRM